MNLVSISAEARNALLERVVRLEGDAIPDSCERVALEIGKVLAMPGDEISHAYFPLDCFLSMIAVVPEGEVEIGLTGHEGMTGFQLAAGAAWSEVKILVQGAGTVLRMPAAAFTRHLSRSAAFRAQVGRYAQYALAEYARSAGCNRYHLVEARLARWLLMVADCARAPSFETTHEAIAAMLGVRRAGITKAAGDLQLKGLIRYTRGHVQILDRPRLEKAACACYKASRRAYATVFEAEADATSDS